MTREEAILCLKGIKNYGRDTFTEQSDWQNSLDMAIKALEQEPKTGHWITKIKSDLRGDMWPTNPKCSECGGEPHFSNTIYIYKFCPYCGAKMAENEEDKES